MALVIVRQASYDYPALRPVIFELMDRLGGGRIRSSSRVVIKPNLLAPAPPEKAVVTHPHVVRAAAEYVLQRGATPRISDSPAVGSFEKILKESGIRDALSGLPVVFREFEGSVSVSIGKPFQKTDIAADAVNADVLINLPKLKTHTQMLLTLGVKNLFGCIVGMKKPEWHLRAGVDREMFARLLVKVCQSVNPSITIIDGVLAMEGQGPGKGGTPRHAGVLLGSENPAAADMAVCRMLGIVPDRLLTNKISMEQGLSPEDVIIDGEIPAVKDFRLPDITPVVFGPRWLHGFLRRHLVQRPECDDSLCRFCGECWKYCPAHAISHKGEKLFFDYDTCIRCYCCIEVCPHGALSSRETVTGKVSRKVLRV